jgi:hypothetical protein
MVIKRLPNTVRGERRDDIGPLLARLQIFETFTVGVGHAAFAHGLIRLAATQQKPNPKSQIRTPKSLVSVL